MARLDVQTLCRADPSSDPGRWKWKIVPWMTTVLYMRTARRLVDLSSPFFCVTGWKRGNDLRWKLKEVNKRPAGDRKTRKSEIKNKIKQSKERKHDNSLYCNNMRNDRCLKMPNRVLGCKRRYASHKDSHQSPGAGNLARLFTSVPHEWFVGTGRLQHDTSGHIALTLFIQGITEKCSPML